MESGQEKKFSCSFCSAKFTIPSCLDVHLRSHTREKPYSCAECNRRFSCKNYLNRHIKHLHKGIPRVHKKNHKCSLCPYTTYCTARLKKHIAVHTEERSFACEHPNCNYAGKTLQATRLHDKNRHQHKRRFLCKFPKCSYRAKTRTLLNAHSLRHSEERAFVCDFDGCSHRAKSDGRLKSHKRIVHSGSKPFPCSMCDHRAKAPFLLRRHEATHLKQKSIECNFSGCNFVCKSKTNLNVHVRLQHTARRFKCEFPGCSAVAANPSGLERHKKDVHYEKPYKCPNCDYRAAHPSKLQSHMKTHGTSQRFPCYHTGCTFRAKNQESLKRHMKFHDKNLGCPVDGCGFVGTSSARWKSHMKVHDPTGQPFHCPLCPQHYKNKSLLARHLHSHTNEKPFKCPACDFGSSRTDGIIGHVRAFHSRVFPNFILDEEAICDHCGVHFCNAIGLAMHNIKLKTALVVLTRLQIKFEAL